MRVLAKRFSVGLGFVRDVVKRYRERGEVKPTAYQQGVKPKVRGVEEEAVREWLSKEPDLTLETLCVRYERGVRVSTAAMGRALKRLEITRKKRRSLTPSGRVSQSNRGGPPMQESLSEAVAQQLIFLEY